MKKTKIKHKLENHLIKMKLNNTKLDFGIKTALKSENFTKINKIFFKETNKTIFENIKFPLEIIFFHNKKLLKQNIKIHKLIFININNYLIKKSNLTNKIKYLSLDIITRLSLVTNKVNLFKI
jgi:hypothetical protein